MFTLQEFLNAASSVYPEIPAVTVDGVFGEETQNAVYAAQALFDFPITGIVGPVLWDTLGIIYSAVRDGEYRSPGQWSGDEMSTEG